MVRSSEIEISSVGRPVMVSPHDDDALIGCGGLIQALSHKPLIVIVTDGHLGYHKIEHKRSLVGIRKREALAAYAKLRIPEENLFFFEYPDMSLRNYQNWVTIDGRDGGYQKLFRVLRQFQPQTVFLPSERDFHPDHRASFDLGWVAAFQARDTLMPDLGSPAPIQRIYVYQVWEPLEVATHRFSLPDGMASNKRNSLREFQSQLNILDELETMGTLRYDEEVFHLVRQFPETSPGVQ